MASLSDWGAARAASKLLITDQHLRQARGNKAVGVIWMKPEAFLRLTTALDDNWFRQIAGRPVQPLHKYNEYAKSGENIIMPMLYVEHDGEDIGRVRGHEGRHRTAAVWLAGGSRVPVAVVLQSHKGYAEYYSGGYAYNDPKVYFDVNDIPCVMKPQQLYSREHRLNRQEPVVIDSGSFKDAISFWKD